MISQDLPVSASLLLVLWKPASMTAFYKGAGIQTQVLVFAREAFYSLVHVCVPDVGFFFLLFNSSLGDGCKGISEPNNPFCTDCLF